MVPFAVVTTGSDEITVIRIAISRTTHLTHCHQTHLTHTVRISAIIWLKRSDGTGWQWRSWIGLISPRWWWDAISWRGLIIRGRKEEDDGNDDDDGPLDGRDWLTVDEEEDIDRCIFPFVMKWRNEGRWANLRFYISEWCFISWKLEMRLVLIMRQ